MTSTQKWLRDNCIKYEEKEKVYTELNTALETFGLYGRSNGWLKVKSDVYTYDDGRTHLLLCLHGLLPISYRNSTYHIPFDMWIPFNYPRGAPIVYVVPAQGMMVKNSKFVDLSGKCDVANYEGTKGSWLDRGEKRTGGRTGLVGLIDALTIWFGKDPPVYSKAATTSQSSTPQPSPAHPVPTPSTSHQPNPPLPPSFTKHVGPPPPTYSPPPAPPRPISTASTSWTPQPPPTFQSRSAAPIPPPIPPPMPPATWTPSPPPTRIQSAPIQHSFQPAPMQPVPMQSMQMQSPPLPTQSIPPPIPAPDLLDSDEPTSSSDPGPAPAPPLPPNPILLSLHASVHGRLTSALQSFQTSLHDSSEHLRKIQEDLLRGEPAIQDEIARLEAVKAVSLNVGARYRQTIEAAERNVQMLRNKGDVSVDELICGPTIVHNQLIDLIAEDNAIEDTIYHLHRALNSGSIELDRFLKTTRVLAEEQFMKRALIEKIQAGLPLGEQVMWG
ncbi:Vps23 core domain-containing protein [Lentinula raphanica]|uniref:Vps23 core domain-containing protein n=1 Tax=Lentinula raphanica TaxID=153919 RepID=A0AA38PEB5_9AGAR|nr:Vps23 core domain-containing protein [Lentinula raphanica]KAJ3841358.1 Vps23 core domain-containing protein [Lentinula raphanica]